MYRPVYMRFLGVVLVCQPGQHTPQQCLGGLVGWLVDSVEQVPPVTGVDHHGLRPASSAEVDSHPIGHSLGCLLLLLGCVGVWWSGGVDVHQEPTALDHVGHLGCTIHASQQGGGVECVVKATIAGQRLSCLYQGIEIVPRPHLALARWQASQLDAVSWIGQDTQGLTDFSRVRQAAGD